MDHVVTKPTEPFEAMGGALLVHQVPAWRDNLVWIIECAKTGEAAIIDGPEAETALAYAEEHGLNVTAIFNTHTHADHIGINTALAQRGELEDWRVVGPAKVAADVPGLTEPVQDGDLVKIGEVEGVVMLTEGHIDGHISYLFGEVLFCGDTLFTGGCGYLFDGPPPEMFRSLMRIAELPGETKICCAHEYTEDNLRFAWSVEPDNPSLAQRIREVWALRAEGRCAVPSTLEVERETNPFLRPGSETLKERVGEAMPRANLSTPVGVFAATRALKDRKDYKTLADDALPLD